ncbi:MAG: LysM peptidoglycan-binding domain-containing protein [Deltaproteobacteria bacterium]|nr:LysM peptidoglycan-binding domain-containing protein [Deltaproteobacteria bacterium]
MEKIKARIFLILLFILVTGCLCFSIPASAEKMTHTVKKGDTLWDICEQYYGDNSLWPKLWEMNSFITNPHLLKPGDVINLFEKIPQKPQEPEPVIEPEPVEKPQPVMGINVEGIINNRNRIGYYSSENMVPWGILFASADKHLILAKNDTVYVIFEKDKKITIGSEFAVGKIRPVKHPVTNKKSGFVFDVSGRIVIEQKAGLNYNRKDESTSEKENSYQAKIIESYEPLEAGDVIMPGNSVSSCILPVPTNTEILANIVTGANKQELIHVNSIVYMDKGHNAGIVKGNIFEIREGNIVIDPKPEKKLTFFEEQVVLPDRILGRILVIETFPDSATAIVLTATEPVEPGDYLKNLSWSETPDFISDKANCPVE